MGPVPLVAAEDCRLAAAVEVRRLAYAPRRVDRGARVAPSHGPRRPSWVVQEGWLPGRCHRRGPIEPALVVQVVQECGQELSGGRQPGIEVPLELFGRLLAIPPR